MNRVLRGLLVAAPLIALAHGAQAQPAGPANATQRCAALAAPGPSSDRFARIPDAPTTIISARVVPAEHDLPELCRIEAQIAPTVGILVRMPTKAWNGKLMMGGCGGPCGNYLPDRVEPALVRNYATVSTDMGHKGPGWRFAHQNIQSKIDFGFRATHVTAVAAKVILDEFYGKAAAKSYFWGCSTGGRQAMMEAQRFPTDFDGILAGAPPYDQNGTGVMHYVWAARANLRPEGSPILTAAKVAMVHKAVIGACDDLDKARDGIIQNPARCTWEPKRIACPSGGGGATCLTAEEAGALRKIYHGPTDARGNVLYSGMPLGSELQWLPMFVNTEDGRPGTGVANFTDFMATQSFYFDPGFGYSPMQFDFEKEYARLNLAEVFYDASNPDLNKFKNAGGKLVVYHGWDDNNIPVGESIKYYEVASRTMGGEVATKEFFRMFLLPAVNHCRYGVGGGEVDWISVIENWAERSQAPDEILAYRMKQEPYAATPRPSEDAPDNYTRMTRHPLPPGSTLTARPVYPYPDTTIWSGRGDRSDPATWRKDARRR